MHGECVRLDELQAADIDKYHCPKCTPMCGPSIMKTETNSHRHDRTDPNATFKPLQVGTKMFVEELSQRMFSSSDDIMMTVSGKQLTLPYLNQTGFNNPILVTDKDGLGITVPGSNYGVESVAKALGQDYVLDIIDCHRQKTCQMTIDQFSQNFNDPESDRVLNCLSLEITELALTDILTPPLVARKLCWVNNVWPSSTQLKHTKPQVQKYCIMSMKDSYTDFHIDFGGTSVWYHVHTGEKHFFLIRPSPGNLSLYERWMRLTTQSETFLGDMVDRCHKLVLKQGQTVFIPTGWIHAVYTPVNSIVFGGNFLHSLNIQLQLRIFELESRLKDPPKYRFPSFEVVHWLAAGKLKKDLADLNSDNTPCPENLLNGIRSLVSTLRIWINEVDKHETIDQLDCLTILKDLNKEVKTAEKISLKVNPPKPERESNRRRKKKSLDEDFIDLSDPSSLYLYDWNEKKGGKKQVNRKKPTETVAVKSRPAVENELEEIMRNHSQSFSLEKQTQRRTVSPLRLSLNTAHMKETDQTPVKVQNEEFVHEEDYDLTDRDSVRQLMVNRRQTEDVTNLKNALDDALADFSVNDDLIIDESPKKKKKPIKLRLSVGSLSDNMDHLTSTPFKNNSISLKDQMSSTKKLPPKLAHKVSLKKKAASLARRADMKMNKVHQDDDYIYPALEASDDEEIPLQKDDAWNPKIKISKNAPKLERPIRDSAKNEAIEKGLKTASEKQKLALKVKKSGGILKAPKPKLPKPLDLDFSADKNKPKKAGSTAKQRLGKILGLKF